MKRTGYLTAVGTQVSGDGHGKGTATMYVEIDGVRIDCPQDSKITIEVEK